MNEELDSKFFFSWNMVRNLINFLELNSSSLFLDNHRTSVYKRKSCAIDEESGSDFFLWLKKISSWNKFLKLDSPSSSIHDDGTSVREQEPRSVHEEEEDRMLFYYQKQLIMCLAF